MSVNKLQFAVACHILTALAYRPQRQAGSGDLADSVRAHPTPVEDSCAVSLHIKDGMDGVLTSMHAGVELQLASMTLQDLLAGVHLAERRPME